MSNKFLEVNHKYTLDFENKILKLGNDAAYCLGVCLQIELKNSTSNSIVITLATVPLRWHLRHHRGRPR